MRDIEMEIAIMAVVAIGVVGVALMILVAAISFDSVCDDLGALDNRPVVEVQE